MHTGCRYAHAVRERLQLLRALSVPRMCLIGVRVSSLCVWGEGGDRSTAVPPSSSLAATHKLHLYVESARHLKWIPEVSRRDIDHIAISALAYTESACGVTSVTLYGNVVNTCLHWCDRVTHKALNKGVATLRGIPYPVGLLTTSVVLWRALPR